MYSKKLFILMSVIVLEALFLAARDQEDKRPSSHGTDFRPSVPARTSSPAPQPQPSRPTVSTTDRNRSFPTATRQATPQRSVPQRTAPAVSVETTRRHVRDIPRVSIPTRQTESISADRSRTGLPSRNNSGVPQVLPSRTPSPTDRTPSATSHTRFVETIRSSSGNTAQKPAAISDRSRAPRTPVVQVPSGHTSTRFPAGSAVDTRKPESASAVRAPAVSARPDVRPSGGTSDLTFGRTPSRLPDSRTRTPENVAIPGRESVRQSTRLALPAIHTAPGRGTAGSDPLTVTTPPHAQTVRPVPVARVPAGHPSAPFIGSRYRDGRSDIYRPPERVPGRRPSAPFIAGGHGGMPFIPQAGRHNRRGHISSGWYPVIAPAAGFSFFWHSGPSYVSVYSYSYWNTPVYTCTPYYDSWSCGGWGYSNVYYDGWHHGWYSGVTYIYNPWPVYYTCYFYDPAPTVVYEVPATSSPVVAAPASNAAVSVTAALPASGTTAPRSESVAAAQAAVPVTVQVENRVFGCSCPCHCDGVRPCVCAYPCGAEYEITAAHFDLGRSFASYAETLDRETIWASYNGLDRTE